MSERKPNFIYPLADRIAVLSFHPVVQRIQQQMNPQKQGVLQETTVNPNSNQERGYAVTHTNPQNPPQSQSQPRKHLLTGDKVRDIGQRMRNFPLFAKREQTGEHQKVSTTPNSTGILSPQPPQQIGQTTQISDQRWYRCTTCQRNYEGQLSHCPECNQPIPDWVYAKTTREKTDISLG